MAGSDIKTTDFKPKNFVRSGGSVSFEERAVQPSDFVEKDGYPYAKEYADSPTQFGIDYPEWQKFADCFCMRRPIISISGRQRCKTKDFKASEFAAYKEVGFVNVKDFAIPDNSSSSIPSGKYQLTSFNFSDTGQGLTDLSVSYQQYGEWQLVKLTTPPALVKAGKKK